MILECGLLDDESALREYSSICDELDRYYNEDEKPERLGDVKQMVEKNRDKAKKVIGDANVK